MFEALGSLLYTALALDVEKLPLYRTRILPDFPLSYVVSFSSIHYHIVAIDDNGAVYHTSTPLTG